ncbi:jumonji family transcription [Moniliophthora roreri MCA 2997]|nr:jumonji family transcription [Moniliophthora roreri MCA 2997]
MASSSPTPSLTPSLGSSPPPNIPVQPDHFYDGQPIHATPDSDGKTWLDPDDDRLASRGIPVFKPTMDEFRDFEAYMKKVECWGMYSGIIKVIPPQEWKDALPPLKDQLFNVKIKTPIEQHMLGRAGLFRQQNMEKRKVMSVREWAELCSQGEFRAPGVEEVGLYARSNVKAKPRRSKKTSHAAKADTLEPDVEGQVHIKEEPMEDVVPVHGSTRTAHSPSVVAKSEVDEKPKAKGRKQQTKLSKEEKLAESKEKDSAFLETFEPHTHWLPPNTKPEDYTPEFCSKLEKQYWRNCGLGKPPWYGADTQGSLYTDDTKEWNVAHLESELSRLLPSEGLPGVNTPYLYWGMWRATFAWHVEDMDLFSINYIHFGAPKFWYSVPQGRASALENAMRSYFPKDTSQCPQFLRHKSFLASPTLLAKSSCKPNHCVQHAGEFMITFPRGYHAGFNLGLNCAESVNFALPSWLELGKVAKACECVTDSVRIDVNKLLEERERRERGEVEGSSNSQPTRSTSTPAKRDHIKREEVVLLIPPRERKPSKRKSEADAEPELPKPKKPKIKIPSTVSCPSKPSIKIAPLAHPKVMLRLPARPADPEPFPCCLCISMVKEGLLRVQDPPIGRKDAMEACGNPKVWMAHADCANIVPETWVDEVEDPQTGVKERAVFGVDAIVKDRWNLKCTACAKNRLKAHGAPIQCTKGKCPKAFHVSCARDGTEHNIVFQIVREVEKDVILLKPVSTQPTGAYSTQVDATLNPDSMVVDGQPSGPDEEEVLRVVKKYEVQVLCSQHNPEVAAAKRASKQDRIKKELLAIPPMARIKIRVSSGVFEVSLVRVIEETGSVEVLWDRGSKKEFKWGNVIFGNTDGPVQHKPSEPAPDPPLQPIVSAPVSTYPSVAVATTSHSQPSMSVPMSYPPNAPYGIHRYPYWAYPAQTMLPYGQGANYSYSYYASSPTAPAPTAQASQIASTSQSTTVSPHSSAAPVPGPSNYHAQYHTTPVPSQAQPNSQPSYTGGQLQWQQPYQPPVPRTGKDHNRVKQPVAGQQAQQLQGPSRHDTAVTHSSAEPQRQEHSYSLTAHEDTLMDSLQPPTPDQPQFIHSGFPTTDSVLSSGTSQSQASIPDLPNLSSMQASQLAELIKSDPALQSILVAAIAQNSQSGGTPTPS